MLEPARQVSYAVLSNVGPIKDPCHYGQQSAPFTRGHRQDYLFDDSESTHLVRLQGLLMPPLPLTSLLVRCQLMRQLRRSSDT